MDPGVVKMPALVFCVALLSVCLVCVTTCMARLSGVLEYCGPTIPIDGWMDGWTHPAAPDDECVSITTVSHVDGGHNDKTKQHPNDRLSFL